jgi:hypothetical protein
LTTLDRRTFLTAVGAAALAPALPAVLAESAPASITPTLTASGLCYPTYAEIYAELLRAYKAVYGGEPEPASLAETFLQTNALCIWEANEQTIATFRALLPGTASHADLDRWAATRT